jgi:hypothetical protein
VKHMPIETKYFIGVGDILRVQFECAKCHRQTSVQPGDRHPYDCPGCNTKWFQDTATGPEHLARLMLGALLSVEAREALKDRPVKVSIEIQDAKEKP